MEQNYIKPCYGKLSDLEKHTRQFLTQNTACKFDNIRLHNRVGKWSAIDTAWLTFKNSASSVAYPVAMFESDYYGDMARYLFCFFDYYSGQWVELLETYDDIYISCLDLEMIE